MSSLKLRADEATVLELIRQGKKHREIIKLLGFSHGKVTSIVSRLRTWGALKPTKEDRIPAVGSDDYEIMTDREVLRIRSSSKPEKNKPIFLTEQHRHILADYRKNMARSEIAKKYNMKKTELNMLLIKMGC